MTGGKSFEAALTKCFNSYFTDNKIAAVAYRHFEYFRREQLLDVLIDSANRSYYYGVECKSIDYGRIKKLYFTTFNRSAQGKHQIVREQEFLERSGRIGVLALEIRGLEGHKRTVALIPWRELLVLYNLGKKGIELDTFDEYPCLYRVRGEYVLTDEIVSELLERSLD